MGLPILCRLIRVDTFCRSVKTPWSISMGECNTILSAYTKYRHLGLCCIHPSICRQQLKDNSNDSNLYDQEFTVFAGNKLNVA